MKKTTIILTAVLILISAIARDLTAFDPISLCGGCDGRSIERAELLAPQVIQAQNSIKLFQNTGSTGAAGYILYTLPENSTCAVVTARGNLSGFKLFWVLTPVGVRK